MKENIMTENFEHYISRNIKAFYKKRLLSPIIYLLILLVLWLIFPLKEMLMPPTLLNNQTIEEAYDKTSHYVRATFSDLTFTGYVSEQFGNTNGYYYYTVHNGECIIVLLDPRTCEQGLPYINQLTVNGAITEGQQSYERLLEQLAIDLDWTKEGISSQLSAYLFSEPALNPRINFILFLIYFGTMFYALVSLILYVIYYFFPVLSPCCQNLIIFGNPKKILEEAEEELLTLPQLATEDMFITEHYFILTSPYGNSIVPIQDILWIYKYSTLHKFLWYHFSITYTLHITTNKRFTLHSPKNIKSDIDGIIDYLSEANHDILVGFNEENRLKVEAVQGKPFHIEKWSALLHRKV